MLRPFGGRICLKYHQHLFPDPLRKIEANEKYLKPCIVNHKLSVCWFLHFQFLKTVKWRRKDESLTHVEECHLRMIVASLLLTLINRWTKSQNGVVTMPFTFYQCVQLLDQMPMSPLVGKNPTQTWKEYATRNHVEKQWLQM